MGDLCNAFIANFRGTYERPHTKKDLKAERQAPGETLCKFIQRFNHGGNKVPHISDADIISAFAGGVTDVRMREKLGVYD